MKKGVRARSVLLAFALTLSLAAPRTSVAAAPQEQTQTAAEPAGEQTEEEKEQDPHQKAMEETYRQEVQTNKLKDWPQGPGIYGEAGIVMDAETGAVLYGKNIDKEEYPASITKLLTALLAFRYSEMTDEVVITAESLACLGNGYATIGMKEGNVISMEQALYAMLLASSNEVAYAVGDAVAREQGQDYQWFLDEMNRTVEELGGTHTHFVNTNGVHDDQHYTSARDMALVARELFAYPEFFTISQTAQYTIPASPTTEEHVFQQKHRMLVPGYEEYYEYVVGGKTGYTTDAKNTLVTLADNGEMKLVCVMLNTHSGHIYTDTRALLDYGFQNFRHVPVEEADSGDIQELPEGAAVTLPDGLAFTDLDRSLSRATGGNSLAALSYTYEDNPVGVMEVKVNKSASFKEAEAPEEEDADGEDTAAVSRPLLIATAAVILLLALVTVWCRLQRRRRRRHHHHHGRHPHHRDGEHHAHHGEHHSSRRN